MTATTPDDASRDRRDVRAAGIDEVGPEATPGSDQSYADDRRTRLRRGRLAGFATCVPLWMLGVVPLARESTDGREGMDVLLVYLVVGAITLGIAVAIRGLYVLVMKRRFWSPWLFALAAVVAIVGYAVQSAGEEEVPFEGAPAEPPAIAPGPGASGGPRAAFVVHRL